MPFRIMEADKERIINALAGRIVSELSRVDSRSAQRLRQLMREGRVYFALSPRARVLKKEVLETRYGRVVSETHGLSTTYYLPGKRIPLLHIILLPEERLLEKKGGKLFLRWQGIETLVHEISHIMYPPEKADKIMGRILGGEWAKIRGAQRKKLAAEALADVITVDFLLRHGRKEEARAYISGRKLTKGVRKRIVEKALQRAREEKKELYAARWKKYLESVRKAKVKEPRLLPGKKAEEREGLARRLSRLVRRRRGKR